MNISCCVAFFSGAPGSGSCDDEDVGAGEGEEDGEDEDGGEDGGLDADGKLAEANSRRVRSDVAEPTCTCSWMVSTVRTPRWSWRRRTPDSSHRTPRYDTDEQRFAVFCMSSVGRSPYRFIFPATTRMRGDTCMLLMLNEGDHLKRSKKKPLFALCLCDDRHMCRSSQSLYKLLARSDPNPPRLDRRPFCLLSLATPSNRRVLHHVSTGLRLAVWSTAAERGRHPATAGTTLAPGKPLIPPGHERDIRPPTYLPTYQPTYQPTYRRPTTQSDHRPRFASTQEKARVLATF